MKKTTLVCLSLFLCLFTLQAEARIQWQEPRVVPEKLKRKNRRVVRFSGRTEPGALVRIQKNKIKLFFDTGKTRWANIPQKNKVQFPMTADGDGQFSFELYLPMSAVEIPVQVKYSKRWRLETLNFRVPDTGKARAFRAMEKSFQASDDEISKIEREDNYYSRKQDKGQLIKDRDGRVIYTASDLEAWFGLGFSFFDMSSDSSSNLGPSASTGGSTLVLPTFRLGVDWDYSKKWLLKGAIRSTSGSVDIGTVTTGTLTADVTGDDFNWLEVQLSAVWFSEALQMKRGNLGFDFGLQLQQLPFFRERPDAINYAFFDNNTWNVHFGLLYRKNDNKSWNYEMYARYLLNLSADDAFDMKSSVPLMFELGGGIKKRVTQGLSFGVFGQLQYFSAELEYVNTFPTRTNTVDYTLMLFTVDARLIANF